MNTANDLKTVSITERRAVFTKVADDIGIRVDMIEKDYWVSWVLNQLFFDPKTASILLFKGGTSLSKAYNVIYRFSEDIDLLLDLREVSDENESFEKSRSRNAINTFKAKISKNTAAYVNDFLRPCIQDRLGKYCNLERGETPGDLFISYPAVFASDSYIRPNIKLEIGAVAEGTPFAPQKISSYVAQKLPQLPEKLSDIPTVSIERTFWEKISILHYLHFLPEEKPMPLRHSRHFYDVYMLANSQYKQAVFAGKRLLDTIVSFDSKFYPKRGVDYEVMNLKTLCLTPQSSRIKDLQNDYAMMQEMIYGPAPSWKELLDFIACLEEEIRAI